ncbi:PREDICTED: protein CASC3-like [Nicrophorus vespilloides]|uniref:Protein CASC3 n=1 Tax=Nicrophorus vespilloides TaxID=110193 RepID=A0ABM1NIS4_NICVS|nr:PREDICTED: protein CASC3-like [Nicrophorus vespilloides]
MDGNSQEVTEPPPKAETVETPAEQDDGLKVADNMGALEEEPVQECVEVVEAETIKKSSTNQSEYDSADSDVEHEEDTLLTHSDHSGSDAGSIILEREEGDGQESAPTKKVDDDEDKKNPQYIPKRGTFYEHDDRTADDDIEAEAVESEEKVDKDGKKKMWTEKKEKWNHDKFNDNEQMPKSRSELISIYGYDIRNEEGPPRARRRRRYGRGPNKYTRNWEDEDAYSKPATPVNTKKPARKSKTSPQLNQKDEENANAEENTTNSGRQSSESQNERTSISEQNTSAPQQPMVQKTREFTPKNNSSHQHPPHHHHPSQNDRQNNKNHNRIGTGRVIKPNRDIKDSDYKGFTKSRQFTPRTQKDMGRDKEAPHSQNYGNKRSTHEIEKEMGKLSVQEQVYAKGGNKQHGGNRQGSIPPRMQGEPKGGSKRYSSIRQRSLPESANPPTFNQQHGYYGNAEYGQNQQQPGGQQSQQQPLLQHPPAPLHPNPAQMPAIPPPPLPTLPPQVPVTTTPLPPQFGAPFAQAPPPFLQAAPPPFIPQQTPQIINYVQGQPQFAPHQAPYQGYQQPFNPVSQPTEIFQPPGGITYYSAQDQQVTQRAAPQKRPKAAIPIVPPPPLEPRGRGRATQEAVTPNASDVESKVEVVPAGNSNYEDAGAAAAVAVEQ